MSDVNWLIKQPPATIKAACRIRYRHQEVPAKITIIDNHTVQVDFEEPQDGVTPGQAAVFYDQDRVIGGGWIDGRGTRYEERGAW